MLRHRRLPPRGAFIAATAAFVLVFASSGTPIPLYHLFRAEDGMTDSDFAFASVGYFAAAVTSLLLLGRLSNHLGRRPVAIGALAAAAGGAVLLPVVHGLLPLLAVRVLQGLAAGVAPSAIGAYVIDTAPQRPHWLPAVITASTPMLGIPLGALLSGLVVEYGANPRLTVAAVMLAALLIVGVLIALSPETMARRPGTWTSLAPRLHVPHGAGRILLATGTAAIATWSLGGFFQAFGPSVTADYLGSDDALVAAIVFGSVMILNPLGGPIAGRLRAVTGVRLGMGIYVLALAGIVAAMFAHAIGAFIAASLVVGIAQGLASTAAMRALVAGIPQHDRAGLLATVYLVSYSGSAIPGLIAGQLARTLPLTAIAIGYAVIGTAAAALASIAIRERQEAETAGGH